MPFPTGKDGCHFSAAVAARAFLEMVTDAAKHVRTISRDPQLIVVVVCAGWNAEPTKGAQPVGSIRCQTAFAFNDFAGGVEFGNVGFPNPGDMIRSLFAQVAYV